ncbi:MAG: Armadillo repeat-containing protein 8 [Cirrosporium novae-zelandiae]|nr:MAG: Armadillo repeat-containing protein 8 [Cirrosporium novae-zelandiae]
MATQSSDSPNPILQELRQPCSPASQTAALKRLKNELIGDELKKEQWIDLGVIPLLSRILWAGAGIEGGINQKVIKGSGYTTNRIDVVGDEAHLYAIIAIGSLARGGPAFISPILHGDIIPALLETISPEKYSSTLVLASLRALDAIADSFLLQHPIYEVKDKSLSLAAHLYIREHIEALGEIISQASSLLTVQQSISLAAGLVSKTCKDEGQKISLVEGGVLDALATQLARFAVAQGYVVPGLDLSVRNPALVVSSSTKMDVAPILQAIAIVLQHSRSRTNRFVSSPALVSIFPRSVFDSIAEEKRVSRNSFPSGTASLQRSSLALMHAFNPRIISVNTRRASLQASNHPPLSGIRNALNESAFLQDSANSGCFENDEPLIIPWLFHLVRKSSGSVRLTGAWLLATFYKYGIVKRQKSTAFALLLVPILVAMLDKEYKPWPNQSEMDIRHWSTSLDWDVKEQAPFILSCLVMDSAELQKAAVDAGVIKKLSQLLKESYDPLPASSNPMVWTPSPTNKIEHADGHPLTTKLGHRGWTPDALHVFRTRANVLRALAAISPFKDEYRKAIVDNGVVPFVIESLQPYPPTVPETHKTKDDPSQIKGNPISVILAACTAARALSRSVSILRTSLIDAGITSPLFTLLEHQEQEVQIAATAVICNLVLEFSPMRDAILKENVLKVLCKHAHSTNTRLRLDTVWALKNLVYNSPKQIKMACIDELGAGWLKQIICNDEEVASLANKRFGVRQEAPITMGTSNAAGEQVDILNAAQSPDMPTSDDEDDLDDSKMVDSIGNLSRINCQNNSKPEGSGTTSYSKAQPVGASNHEADHETERETSINGTLRDDLAVQEQGLDLIRNLICPPAAEDMIDYLFRELGHDKVFEILAAKLRPYYSSVVGGTSNTLDQEVTPPEIIISVCYVLVSIAGGLPRHRQLLISQTELLRLLMPLFNHRHREIRTACVWVVINLTWVDDEPDRANCKARAQELADLGIMRKLKELETDQELDVRERMKTASHQMKDLLRAT